MLLVKNHQCIWLMMVVVGFALALDANLLRGQEGGEKLPEPVVPQVPIPQGQRKPGEQLPEPRRFLPFGPNRPRLPLLGEKKRGGFGKTPVPTKEDLKDYAEFIDKVVDPRNTLDLVQNRARLIFLKETPTRIQVSDENIVTYNLVKPKQLTVLGLQVGTTVMNLWFPDAKKPGEEKVLSYLVRVIPDPEAKERLERVYEALADEINKTFPNSVIHLRLVGDKLVVTGQTKDIVEATQILRIVRANAPPEDPATVPVDTINVDVRPGDPLAGPGTPGLEDFLIAGGPNVINLIKIAGEQQVLLKVTVAEVNRTAARSIGLNFSITNDNGVQVFANRTGNIATGGLAGTAALAGGGLGGLAGGIGNALGLSTNNLPVALDNGQINLAINALRALDYARSLAEPNLVALNGETANFQAGGSFPVPVVASGGFGGGFGGNLQGVNFIPFGVQLAFTPFVTDRDRIRLTVAADVSVRDIATGTQIAGAAVPGLNTRNFQTTVELREGQTLAVAGLIQNNLGAMSTRVPFFGDIPILTNLTGFQRISHGEQELVILVTPELVHPLEHKEKLPLPGSDLFEPGDLEFYVLGRLESRRHYDYRSPVMTDFHRMKRYIQCERIYIQGPHGHVPPAH